jgi:REP element-mobilizing transposase RayT
MSNTYTKVYIQAVWAVKYRKSILDKKWRKELFSKIGSFINETGCKVYIVNGVEDHVHCFFSLKPSISISEVMKLAKGKSSKWLNESGYLDNHFEWQRGFATFSYSESAVNNVYNYIENQEKHHEEVKFIKEYKRFLKEFGIEYDERYIFKELM